jgi:hypothetical protein
MTLCRLNQSRCGQGYNALQCLNRDVRASGDRRLTVERWETAEVVCMGKRQGRDVDRQGDSVGLRLRHRSVEWLLS